MSAAFDYEGEQHDEHVFTWIRAKVEEAFGQEIADLLDEAADTLRAGEAVDWRRLRSDMMDLPEDVDFQYRRGDYTIDLVLPPVILAVIGEAWDLARAGETAEALHRLSLLTRPKWPSEAACRDQYTAAMAEARTVRRRAALGPFADTPLGATLL